MKYFEGTPGAWKYEVAGSLIVAEGGDKDVLVAQVATNTRRDEGRHNARVLTAAKLMLNALQEWRRAEKYSEEYGHMEAAREDVAEAWELAMSYRDIAIAEALGK